MRLKFTALAAAVLSAVPVFGADVPVTQIEALEYDSQLGDDPNNLTRYAAVNFNGNPTAAGQGQFSNLTFHAVDSTTLTNTGSIHAQTVATDIAGTGTVASAFVGNVYAQSLNSFFNKNVLTQNAGTGTGPLPLYFDGGVGTKIINNSYIASYGSATQNLDAQRRIDYMINRDDVTFVAGAVSSVNGSTYQPLAWSSFNSLAVAGSNGAQNFDPTNSQNSNGKQHADLFFNGDASFSTAYVSGYAAALFGNAQTARQTDALHGVVIRSMLMTGADYSTTGTLTANHLDVARGAGVADYYSSLNVLTAGEKTVSAATAVATATLNTTQSGWSKATSIVNGQQVLLLHSDNAITGLDATLNWDVTSPTVFDANGTELNTAAVTFYNLGLQLRTVTGTAGNYVLGPVQTDAVLKSALAGDNVQHIYSTETLPAGNYALVVSGDPSLSTVYGLSYTFSGSFASSWSSATGGSWGTVGSWTNGIPSGRGAVANFLASPGITAPSTITLDSNRTVGQINFANANSYTIANGTGGLLIVDDTGDSTGTVNPKFAVTLGTHTIAATVALNNGLTVNAASGTALNLSGTVYGSGGLTKTGAGTLTLGGADAYGNTTVNAGTLAVTAGQTWGNGTVSVNTGGTLTFAAGSAATPLQRNLTAALSVNAGGIATIATPSSVAGRQLLITTGGFTLASTGKLDVTSNDLDLVGADLPTVTAQLKAGYLGGTTGITSSTAAANPARNTALGVILNSAGVYGTGNLFDGYAPATTDVLVKYTYYGDANLDGHVDGSDYTLIDNGYNQHLTGWANGDFNYDGVVNGSDYTLIDNAFNTQAGTFSPNALFATSTAQFASTSAVPEPATLGVLALAGVLCRPRPKKQVR